MKSFKLFVSFKLL